MRSHLLRALRTLHALAPEPPGHLPARVRSHLPHTLRTDAREGNYGLKRCSTGKSFLPGGATLPAHSEKSFSSFGRLALEVPETAPGPSPRRCIRSQSAERWAYAKGEQPRPDGPRRGNDPNDARAQGSGRLGRCHRKLRVPLSPEVHTQPVSLGERYSLRGPATPEVHTLPVHSVAGPKQ